MPTPPKKKIQVILKASDNESAELARFHTKDVLLFEKACHWALKIIWIGNFLMPGVEACQVEDNWKNNIILINCSA